MEIWNYLVIMSLIPPWLHELIRPQQLLASPSELNAPIPSSFSFWELLRPFLPARPPRLRRSWSNSAKLGRSAKWVRFP